MGTYKPNEIAFDMGYSKSLGPELALGGNLRYIRSNLFGGASITNASVQAGNAIAVDVSVSYKSPVFIFSNDSFLDLGLTLSNIGTKIRYSDPGQSYFLPGNVKLGTALKFGNEDNKITLALDLDKLMVPTQPRYDLNGNIVSGRDPDRSVPSGILGSFTDAPGGFSEELKEIGLSSGIEFSLKDKVFFRGGFVYQHPQKGNISYLTTGLGFNYSYITLDFSYIIGSSAYNPLANTLRFGVQANFRKD
jgi:hypothetical protein